MTAAFRKSVQDRPAASADKVTPDVRELQIGILERLLNPQDVGGDAAGVHVEAGTAWIQDFHDARGGEMSLTRGLFTRLSQSPFQLCGHCFRVLKQAQATNLQLGNTGGGCTLLGKRLIVCYDAACCVPDWVAYRLGRSEIGSGASR